MHPMMKIDAVAGMTVAVRDLRAFVAVAEEAHVTRAAARLGMQQPHLSRLLQRMEAAFATPLLRRDPRGVRCTTAGEALLRDARVILALSDALLARVTRAANGESGRLSLGYTSSVALHPAISAAIRSFRERYTDIALAFEEAGTGTLIEALERGALDAALVRTPVKKGDAFTVERILSEPMIAAFPRGHELAKGAKALPVAALSDAPFILYRRASGPGLYDAIVAACRHAGFSPRIVQEAPRLTATLSLVASGLGITIVPASMRTLHLDGVIFRDLRDESLAAVIDLVSRSDNDNPALGRFREFLRAAVADGKNRGASNSVSRASLMSDESASFPLKRALKDVVDGGVSTG